MNFRAKQKEVFESPLTEFDTENQTLGCRHTNPCICKNIDIEAVCAFVRKDGICLCPGKGWKKKFKELKGN